MPKDDIRNGEAVTIDLRQAALLGFRHIEMDSSEESLTEEAASLFNKIGENPEPTVTFKFE